jgi:ATP-dependent DNA ligase
MPLSIPKPMLAQKAEAPFDSPDHLFEIKWDGIRCLALIEGRQVGLQSRRFLDITSQFPELACLEWLPSGTVLDGELLVLRDGKPSLRAIQHRALLQNCQRVQWLSRTRPVTYMVFDLLYLKAKPLLATPLSLRREALQTLIEQVRLPGVLVPEAVQQHGCRLFAQVARLGLEGIMAKRLDGPYLPGKRSRYWLKIKPRPETERANENRTSNPQANGPWCSRS